MGAYRSIQTAALLCIIVTLSPLCAAQDSGSVDSDLQTVKSRVLELLLCPAAGPRSLDIRQSMDSRGELILSRGFEPIESTNPQEATFNQRLSGYLGWVHTLANCWASEGSRLYHNDAALERALAGLDSVLMHLTPESPRTGNWYYWYIEIPQKLGEIGLMLGDAIDTQRRDRLYEALEFELREMTLNGANAAWEARNNAYLALMQKDPQRLSRAIERVFATLRYGSDNGVQEDYGYLFHGSIPYAGGYGAGFVQTAAQFMFLCDQTRWQCELPRRQLIANTLLEHVNWFVVRGCVDPLIRGRGYRRLSRGGDILSAMLYMSRVDCGRENELATAAGGMLADKIRVPVQVASLADDLSATNTQPSWPQGYRYWRSCELGCYRNRDYHVSFRQFSDRVQDYEYLTNSGATGWLLAYGFTYITRNGREIFDGPYGKRPIDDFDWQRLPGTTNRVGSQPVNTTDNEYSCNFGSSPVAGSAFLDDGGMAGFILEPAYGDFVARKSLFFFDGGFVALGSAISSTEGFDSTKHVQTGVLQWAAPSEDAEFIVSTSGKPLVLTDGQPQKIKNVNWLFIDNVGVSFYGGADINVLRRGKLFCVWLDHGTNPQNASYAYCLWPDTTIENIKKFAGSPTIRPLRSDASVHCVLDANTDTTGAVFFAADSVVGIKAPAASCVYITGDKKNACVAVSGLTHEKRKLDVTLPVSSSLAFTQLDKEMLDIGKAANGEGRTISVESAYGRVYRGSFGKNAMAARPLKREDMSAYYDFRVEAESEPGQTILTLYLSPEIVSQDFKLLIEGCRGHGRRLFNREEAIDWPDENTVRFSWDRSPSPGATGNKNLGQEFGDFRARLISPMKMATEYFIVPHFDDAGNPSYPQDVWRDTNQPPRYRKAIEK